MKKWHDTLIHLLSLAATVMAMESTSAFAAANTTDNLAENPTYQQISLQQLLTSSNTPQYDYDIIKTLPHDKKSFTEGLLIDEGYLYESIGLYGVSALRKIDLSTGAILKEYALPTEYFAEGITILGNQLYQLTYKERTGFVYDKKTFKVDKTFSYSTQGWGLTTDGQQLIMSDGSDKLTFINPQTLQITGYLSVTDNKHRPVYALNELEYVNGKVFANVWPTEIIIIISLQTGIIEGWINIAALKPQPGCMTTDCVANGIAYDNKANALYVTGKHWPSLYLINIKSPH